VPLHALELLLDEDGDAFVRDIWDDLAAASLPSQAHHRGASNAPHVTLVAVPGITTEQAAATSAALAPLLPVALTVTGLALFGRRRSALALLVAPPPSLTAVVDAQRTALGDSHDAWMPHVTLARRLDATGVGQAVGVLTRDGPWPTLTADRLRHWDPDARVARMLG